MYDVLIVGAGPAGLTAAIYCGRKKLKTLVVSLDVGGQINLTPKMENYPGYEEVNGLDLARIAEKQARKFGAEITSSKVTKVNKIKNGFEAATSTGQKLQAKAVILAFGRLPQTLNIPGEEKYLGKGVHTCVTCDAPMYSKRTVAVIGGGNAAVDGALELVRIGANKVYLIHRREEFRADAATLAKARKEKKIEMFINILPVEVKGTRFVESLLLENKTSEERFELKLNGIFVEIGSIVDTSCVQDLVKLNEKKEIIIDSLCRTSQKGVFAAGEVSSIPYKQAVISAGEGAKAALSAYQYLTGGKGVMLDWK